MGVGVPGAGPDPIESPSGAEARVDVGVEGVGPVLGSADPVLAEAGVATAGVAPGWGTEVSGRR